MYKKNSIGIFVLSIVLGFSSVVEGQKLANKFENAAQDTLVKSASEKFLETRISLRTKNQSLQKVLKNIQQKSGVNIVYTRDMLPGSSSVSLTVEKQSLKEVLDELLTRRGLGYLATGRYIILQKKPRSLTQETINGIVLDASNSEILPGVNILVKGTTTGTSTDSEGNFELTVPSLQDTLVISFVGYEGKEVPINGRTTINVRLNPSTISGEEMVVVGMTEQQKDLVVSSVSSVDIGSNIDGKPITQLSQALQGSATGITVQQGSGLPGGGAANIKIRGIGTLGNTDPLILVDGVPGDLNDVDPANVNDVTVLKDAAAASMYGSRGANGVILVSTKRGISGQIKVEYNGYGGVQTPTYQPNFVSAPEYMQIINEARSNIGQNKRFTEEEIKITREGTQPLQYPNTDWQKEIMEPSASIMNHSINVSGGGRSARFATTASYLKQGGIMESTSYDKYMFRANTGVTITEGVGMMLDLRLVRDEQKQPSLGAADILGMTYGIPPTIIPKYPKTEGQPIAYPNYSNEMRNPKAQLDLGGRSEQFTDKLTLNFRPHWDISPNLTLNFQYNYQMSTGRRLDARDSYNFIGHFSNQLEYTWEAFNDSELTGKYTYNFLESNLDYNVDIGDHKISTLVGGSQQYESPDKVNITTLRSVFGQLHYSYDERYLFQASLRFDGSSRFGPGNKWGKFPSFSAGWNVTNEKFMEPVEALNNWKIRASYGYLGNNQNVGNYAYQTTIDNGQETSFGNPNITWETVRMLNLGTDIDLFEKVPVQITADWYDKITDDILLSPPIAFASGRQPSPINAGKVRNRGWEINANIEHNFSQDFNIYGSFGLSTYDNTILELPAGPYFPENSIHKKGDPIGMYYGYKTDGLLQPSDIDNNVPIFEGQQAGDIKYVDINEDGTIDNSDRTTLGNPNATTNYFLNLGFNYKGFDFETMINAYGENLAVLSGRMAGSINTNIPGAVPMKWQTDYWRPDNQDAQYPRLVPNQLTSSNVTRFSDFWFEDAAYARVEYIQMGYSLNTSVTERLNIDRLRFYVNLERPFTFTDYGYLDPESQGTISTYPLMSVYTLGLQVSI